MSLKTAAENVLFGYPKVSTSQPSKQDLADLFQSVQHSRATFAALLADADLSYAAESIHAVAPGDYVEAGGCRYRVAASGAGDHHLATAGGVKLYAAARGGQIFASQLGMGTSDDTAAINILQFALASGLVKHFVFDVAATYKDSSGSKLAAIQLTDVGDFTIEFVPGRGKLILDNLDEAGNGTGGGLFISGTASNIAIINPEVTWKTKPANRSDGDGIMFKGYPGPAKCLSNIKVLGKSKVSKAAQTGMIFLGCRDVYVQAHEANDTHADGLHFNACQNVQVDSNQGVNVGDDGLALVTYYHATDIGGGGENWKASREPYNQSALGTWSNYNTTVSKTAINSGDANGARVVGSYNVSIGELQARNVNNGLMLDAEEVVGGGIGWVYHATRSLVVGSVNAIACETAVRNRTTTGTSGSFTEFDVHIGKVTGRSCAQYTVLVSGVQGLTVGSIKSHSAALQALKITSAPGLTAPKCNFGKVEIPSNGDDTAVIIDHGATQIDIERILCRNHKVQINGVSGSVSGIHIGRIVCSELLALNNLADLEIDTAIVGGRVFVDGNDGAVTDVFFGRLQSRNSNTYGVNFRKVTGLRINDLEVIDPNFGNSAAIDEMRALFLNRCSGVLIDAYRLDANASISNLRELEIGGGVAGDIAGEDITITTMRLLAPGLGASNVTVQTGSYGPANIAYSGKGKYSGGWAAIPDVDTY